MTYPMPTLAPMNRARKPCSSQWGALRRFVTRMSTSKLTNQAHAPQSAAAARTLCLFATSLALLSQNVSRSSGVDHDGVRVLSNLIPIRLWKSCGFRDFCSKKGKLAYEEKPARAKQNRRA